MGIGIVAYGALSRGLLSGALDGGFEANDFRAHAPRFQGRNLEHNLRQVESLRSIAARIGYTPAQLAIARVLSRGQDIVALIGTSKRSRLAENLRALDVRLTAADGAELDVLFAPGAIAGERYDDRQMALVAR